MRTQGYDRNHLRTAGSLLTFALVCLFSFLSVLIVVIGVQAYGQIVRNADTNTQLRISLSYTANKIRAHDGLGKIEAKQQGNMDTLALHQTIEGDEYVTYIYSYQGMLYEWFTSVDAVFDPELGEALIPVESFHITVSEDGILQEFVDSEGVQYTQFTAVFSQ